MGDEEELKDEEPADQKKLANNEEPPSNEVYVWGDDSRGQLGLSGIYGEHQLNFELPQICSFGILIKQVACGEYHTVFASDTHLLYSMGCNKHGQLGINEREINLLNQPTLIPELIP